MGRGFPELNLSSIYKSCDCAVYFLQLKSLRGKKNIHTVSAAWVGSRFNEIRHTWNPGACRRNRINASLIPTLFLSARPGFGGSCLKLSPGYNGKTIPKSR